MSMLCKATGHIHWRGKNSTGMYLRFPKACPAGDYLLDTNTSIYSIISPTPEGIALVLTRMPEEDIAPEDNRVAYRDSSGGIRVYVCKRVIMQIPEMKHRWIHSEAFKFFGKYHIGAGIVLRLLPSFARNKKLQKQVDDLAKE